MGKKDILKVECDPSLINLDILGFIDHTITVNVIKDGEIQEKKELILPKEVKNVITVVSTKTKDKIFFIVNMFVK